MPGKVLAFYLLIRCHLLKPQLHGDQFYISDVANKQDHRTDYMLGLQLLEVYDLNASQVVTMNTKDHMVMSLSKNYSRF